jgi:myo-inositol-1(or 4)-monophosphatase
MPQDPYRTYRELAERAALESGELLKASYGHVLAREKGPGDLVTEADRASQNAIAATLFAAFPDHTLLAEEDDVVPDPS